METAVARIKQVHGAFPASAFQTPPPQAPPSARKKGKEVAASSLKRLGKKGADASGQSGQGGSGGGGRGSAGAASPASDAGEEAGADAGSNAWVDLNDFVQKQQSSNAPPKKSPVRGWSGRGITAHAS